MCAMCVPCPHRVQRRRSEPLELWLQMIVSHHVGVKDWSLIPSKSNKCSFMLRRVWDYRCAPPPLGCVLQSNMPL